MSEERVDTASSYSVSPATEFREPLPMPVFHSGTNFPLLNIDAPDDWKHLIGLCRSFLTNRDLTRIKTYLGGVAKAIVVEAEYIDKDYRDTYSHFYSKKFANYPPRTVRLHVFDRRIPESDFWNLQAHSEGYVGFLVIRPTRINCIGRTILDPRKIPIARGAMCQTGFKVNLLGAEFYIRGFPFITQDSDVTVCAHAACWMTFRYFSEKYARYGERWPYEITQLTADQSLGRLVPSRGVPLGQISEIFAGFGFAPEVYAREVVQNTLPHDPKAFLRILYRYIESGIPVVAGLKDHALTIFGHVSDYNAAPSGGVVTDSFDYLEAMVVNDDNHLPYQLLASAVHPTVKHPDGYTLEDVDVFVVPTYEKVHFLAEDAEAALPILLNDSGVGLAATNSSLPIGQTISRVFLTSSRSYKRHSMARLPAPIARLYSLLPMPKFIWVAELSKSPEFSLGKVLGEIIWDATANKYDPFSFLVLHYPELVVLNDRHSLVNEPHARMSVFNLPSSDAYPRYTNNLDVVR